MDKSRITAYLFDFDGTLVDSMPTYVSTMLRILDENQVKYDDSIIKTITPLGCKGTAEYYQSLGVSASVNDIIETVNRYAEIEYRYNIVDKQGVKDTLVSLKDKYSLNILTACPHSLLDPCLKRLGLWELFDNIWSCDDFNTTKVDPKIYQMVADRLGIAVDNVAFVDDNIEAVRTAKGAGLKTYGIYDSSSHELIEEMKRESDHYIMTFDKLLEE